MAATTTIVRWLINQLRTAGQPCVAESSKIARSSAIRVTCVSLNNKQNNLGIGIRIKSVNIVEIDVTYLFCVQSIPPLFHRIDFQICDADS